MTELSIETLEETVNQARKAGRPMAIEGGGTRRFYGREIVGEPLSLANYSGIVEYYPTELVITSRAGTAMSELSRILAENGQILGFEPPVFGAGSTLGGTIAMGMAGPGRPYRGSVQDFVLGMHILTGTGKVMHFGGQVIKNVAGFDISRLMVGALGCLGIILDISIKVIPQPQCEKTLSFEYSDGNEAVAAFNSLAGKPFPVTAAAWFDGIARVRLTGSSAGINSAVRKIGGAVDEEGAEFWRSIRNHTHRFFRGNAILRRVNIKPSAPLYPGNNSVLIDWGGALRWYRGEKNNEVLNEFIYSQGGYIEDFRSGDRSKEMFPVPDSAMMKIHRSLKQAFDPDRILNPGRMYVEL